MRLSQIVDKLHPAVAFNQATANNRGNYYGGTMPYKAQRRAAVRQM